jgi:hypothetical protein
MADRREEEAMKVKVTSVSDDSFNGKDGRVLAAKLTYTDENGSNTLPGYGPAMAQVLKWQAGEEQEIETYTTRNGKAAFRLPNSGGGRGGGAGFAAAYRNTKEGQEYEQRQMNRRTAMMKSAEVHAALKTTDLNQIFALADRMDEWLEKA